MKRRVGDIEMLYRFDGPEDGPLVMMAHALGTSHRIWDWQLAALVDRYRLLRYDWRGHGQTDAPPGPYSLDQFVADTVGLLDALAIARVHFVGLSTGGMIGQGFAIQHPDRVASLALCNTMTQAPDSYRAFVKERERVLQEGGWQAVWEGMKRVIFTDGFVERAPAELETVRQMYVATPVNGLLGATAAVAALDYLDRLPRIGSPTLVLGAGDDPVTPPEQSYLMHENIAASRLAMLDGLRHFSNVENPAAFNLVLRDFLDERTAAA